MVAGSTRRRRRHEDATREVLAVARRQVARGGPGAVSLRAIAQEMQMTGPAVYHYFASRNDLLNALVQDGFTSLAAAIELAAGSERDAARRLASLLDAYRDWALAHPHDYLLAFGAPVPGYEPVDELRAPMARRSMRALVQAIALTRRSRRQPAATVTVPGWLGAELARWRMRYRLDGAVVDLATALRVWTHAHGIVSLELSGHLATVLGDGRAFYRRAIEQILGRALPWRKS